MCSVVPSRSCAQLVVLPLRPRSLFQVAPSRPPALFGVAPSRLRAQLIVAPLMLRSLYHCVVKVARSVNCHTVEATLSVSHSSHLILHCCTVALIFISVPLHSSSLLRCCAHLIFILLLRSSSSLHHRAHHLHRAAALIIFFARPYSFSSLGCCAYLHCCTVVLISSLRPSFAMHMSSVRVIFFVVHSATSSLHCAFLCTLAHQFALAGNPFSHFWPW